MQKGGENGLPMLGVLSPSLQGILNVWHLVAYQCYYDGLVRAAMPSSSATGSFGGGSSGGGGSGSSTPSFAAALNKSGSNVVEVRSWEAS